MSDVVQFEKQGSVGIIWVDSPPVNALSQKVRAGLVQALDKALTDSGVSAIVLACRGRTFIAGADITEFGKPPGEPDLQKVIERYDSSEKPIVAAIHGTALGGGLELALACDYRVISPDAKCGLPEVKLGILPGAGGTQRLPRLIGVAPALELIVSGDPVNAKRARELGIADEIIDGDLVAGALRFAESVASKRPLPRARELTKHVQSGAYDPAVFEQTKREAAKRTRGAQAPGRCVDAVKAAVERPFEQGLVRERELFTEAVNSRESQAMRHVFFAERSASKIPDVPSDTPTLPIREVAVLGAGTMGAGIAMVFANAGMNVILLDREMSFVENGLANIQRNYQATVAKKKLSEADMAARVGRIRGTTNYDELANCDLVIEAVFEEMGLKREIFGKLSQICRPDAILATNTSTLDVNEIARSATRPERVLGLHFFSPANVMRLLEIVRGQATDKTVIQTSMKLSKQIGKVGVLVGVCHGFVGNRMLHQYYREANFLVQEGASPGQVDKLITGLGFAMGPFATSDLAGIDVGWRIRKALPKPPPGERYSGAVPDRLAEMGRFGQKTKAGFYKYSADGRTPVPDPEVDAIIAQVSQELGIQRRQISDEEILERCLYSMINEGAKILDEGIALRASDIDTVWINGYGFPVHRGGPMFYADTIGLSKIYEGVLKLREVHGKVWQPSKLLAELAKSNGTFVDWDKRREG